VLHQPFALTLYAFYQLQDRDRVAELRRRIQAVDQGVLTSMAFNQPKALDRERSSVVSEMRTAPSRDRRHETREDLLAAGRALADRIEAMGVLREPEPTHG
jgi:hypothetical protein